MTVRQAREFLESKGYVTGTLWHVDDVMSKYVCGSDEAREIIELAEALNVSRIYDTIREIANDKNLKEQEQ